MSHPQTFEARRLSRGQQSALFARIIDRTRLLAHGTGPRPVLVFDLDGTLMDNRPRVVAILHELAEHWSARHPEAAERCRTARPEDIVYGFGDNLRKLGVSDAELHDAGFLFWRERFFTDHHQRHDVGVAGAREFVLAAHRAGGIIVYLTGRDLPNMALGAFASLRDLGFPIGVVGTELVVKPAFEIPDADFKRDVAPELARLGVVVASFDNEPGNCNALLHAYPESEAVFLDTQYAPNPPPLDPRVSVVRSFEAYQRLEHEHLEVE